MTIVDPHQILCKGVVELCTNRKPKTGSFVLSLGCGVGKKTTLNAGENFESAVRTKVTVANDLRCVTFNFFRKSFNNLFKIFTNTGAVRKTKTDQTHRFRKGTLLIVCWNKRRIFFGTLRKKRLKLVTNLFFRKGKGRVRKTKILSFLKHVTITTREDVSKNVLARFYLYVAKQRTEREAMSRECSRS